MPQRKSLVSQGARGQDKSGKVRIWGSRVRISSQSQKSQEKSGFWGLRSGKVRIVACDPPKNWSIIHWSGLPTLEHNPFQRSTGNVFPTAAGDGCLDRRCDWRCPSARPGSWSRFGRDPGPVLAGIPVFFLDPGPGRQQPTTRRSAGKTRPVFSHFYDLHPEQKWPEAS